MVLERADGSLAVGLYRGITGTAPFEGSRSITDLIDSRELEPEETLTWRLLREMGFGGEYVPETERPEYVNSHDAVFSIRPGLYLSAAEGGFRRSSACGDTEYNVSFELVAAHTGTKTLRSKVSLLGWSVRMHPDGSNLVKGGLYHGFTKYSSLADITLLSALRRLIKYDIERLEKRGRISLDG